MNPIRVFRYIEELDAFVITEDFKSLANYLGLSEWHSAVWVGRLFAMDNDVGEHWFDNWEERDERAAKAEELGVAYDDLMIIEPERM
ncbi:MAG TPA: hypothetical protein VGO11_09190, partial [Chthoniobacteraceae bacterium]|nr:hypothetical protein [Chthoniobacteraceae bacterium]